MTVDVDTYAVHQTVWPLLFGLGLGWAAVLAGSIRWGLRFVVVALPLGLFIPASQFLLRPGLWRGLLDPEVVAWNAAYWLIPACGIVGLALLLRRSRRHVR
jgi:hypothetical protein